MDHHVSLVDFVGLVFDNLKLIKYSIFNVLIGF